MRSMTIAAICIAALTTGCHKKPVEESAPAADAPVVHHAFKDVDPEGWKDNVPAAMQEVAPSDRASFQKLMACEIQKASRSGQPAAVTADFIRQTNARLKADPSAAANCASM